MTNPVVGVTGANGFVGVHLCDALRDAGWTVRAIVRRKESAPASAAEVRAGVDLERPDGWGDVLHGVHTLVHCAGVAHRTFDDVQLARDTFDRINREAAIGLGRAAVAGGVRRLVFLSSVGVYGHLEAGTSAHESTECRPLEPYAVAKLAAERELTAVCDGTTTELVVLRPPLVYGPRCPGNFARLVWLVRTGAPLPLAGLSGRRHFVSVSNLADLVVMVCDREDDASGIFNVADADEIDLGDIVRAIGRGLGRPVRLVRVSPRLLRAALRLIGREAIVDKLNESITVDASRARERFGWTPAVGSVDGMQAAAASFGDEASS